MLLFLIQSNLSGYTDELIVHVLPQHAATVFGKGFEAVVGMLLRMYSWSILRPHIRKLTVIAILEDDVFLTSSPVHCCRSPSRTSSTHIGLGLYY